MAGIMDAIIARFTALPIRSNETWQGGLVPLRAWVRGEGSEPYRPLMSLWVAKQASRIHCGEVVRPDLANLSLAVASFFELALDSEFGGYRPGCVEVADGSLAEHLSGLLAETGVDVRQVDHLEVVERVLDDMEAAMNGGHPSVPGLLDGVGVREDDLREFAAAAAAYYLAKPWRYLSDIDLIRVDAPRMPKEMACCTVLGAGGSMFGLVFYPSPQALFDMHRAGVSLHRPKLRKLAVWQLSFNSAVEFPPKDADIWSRLQLPVAGDKAFPLFVRLAGAEPVVRAGEKEMRGITAVLWALAVTGEAEIDSGQWRKSVTLGGRAVDVELSIPDLVRPPTAQQWMLRGFAPDRRAHERLHADMERFFREHPADDLEQMNELLAQQFNGRSIDNPVTRPTTPLEQAQDLCYQAYDVFGRRRVQLARAALRKSADCADACVILAEQAGTREDELEYYSQGVAAGLRALGPEMLARDVGHFWGIASTRPYMRAVFGLAQTLEKLGRHAEAAQQYQELLRLNPHDNQGARYLLLPRLLELGRDEDAARLLKAYDEDSANWTYARALLAFRLSGPCPASNRELRIALKANPHVPRFLLTDERWPLPEHYRRGSAEEAAVVVEELGAAFRATPGATDWVQAEIEEQENARHARKRELRRKERRRENRRKRR